ncbi:uncharacterized protein LODBEIA_P61270 [Lodderomyces beijingensis]|uniref:Mitochondrial import inner membrane translocase subunit TIM54 n=1 Tax=Lodderomyces beijingensis TaxID=1775926 RepID=A0ABP0ZUT5_9ASCO
MSKSEQASDRKPDVKPDVKADTKPDKAVKKGYRNPALRMMGIKRISLPSRNWMIFWSVLVGIGSSIAYDKYEQKQIRKKWMASVQHLGEEIYGIDRIPRKLTIYIAPPPNDYLDESLKLFKKFIKPVLNSGTLDFEIFSENRQGDIRASVAQRIRDLRIKEASKGGAKESSNIAEPEPVTAQKVPAANVDMIDTELKARSSLYKAADVLGLYRIFPKEIEITRDDSNDDVPGGVICIGRGAFKEYISGLHEGLLGPLVKPEAVAAEEERRAKELAEKASGAQGGDDDDDEANLKPVPMMYISGKGYQDAPLAPEFDMSTTIKNEHGVAQFFEQPIYVFPVPKVQGILNIPTKIYRYFTKRFLADDFGDRTSHIVNRETRPFVYKDILMAKEEEMDWPRKWVQKGVEKGSEWVQELEYDDRVISRLRVFDDKK